MTLHVNNIKLCNLVSLLISCVCARVRACVCLYLKILDIVILYCITRYEHVFVYELLHLALTGLYNIFGNGEMKPLYQQIYRVGY